MLPRVFLNAWRAWQRVPVPLAPAYAGSSRLGFARAVDRHERYAQIAAAVTELARAAMGSRQWDYCALAADQLSELHAAEVAAGDATESEGERAFIAATRALLAEFGRIP